MVGQNYPQLRLASSKLKQWHKILIFLVALIILVSAQLSVTVIAIDTSSAKQVINKAPIVLDGRELFEIGGLGKLKATERAAKINSLLKEKVKLGMNSTQPLLVTIAQQSQWTVLRIDNRHLVTVAKEEITPGMGVQEQALIWQEKIQTGLQQAITERTPKYRLWAAKNIALGLGIVLLTQIGLFCLKRYFRRRLLGTSSKKWYSWAILGLLVFQATTWLIFVYYSVNFFPVTRSSLYQIHYLIDRNFNAEIIDLGGNSAISLHHLAISIFLGISWWFLVGWLAQLLKLRLLPLTRFEDTLQNSIAFLTRYCLLFLGLLLILNSVGIDFRSLAIILSALGVGIGFGLQNIVKDFISGILISLTRPIKIGELVEVGEYKGLVMRIGARTTDISHIDRYIMTVPNSRFIEETVKNWHRSGLTRVKVYIDVAYKSDRDLVYKALLSAAQIYHPDILKHPPPKVKLRNFGERSLLFRVVVFIKDPLKEPKVRNHLQLHIDANLCKYGIEIPFPQQDIHIKVPQFDELVANVAQTYAPAQPKLYYPRSAIPPEEETIKSSLPDLNIRDEYDWQALIEAMRGDSGLSIQDRRYGFKIYRRAFSGTEAVAWLMEREKATRAEAIAIGQMMLEQGIIHHVLDEHNFEDEPLFYRFYLDEEDQNLDWEEDN